MPGRVIDIHQHTNYSGRSDEELIAHQRKLGISRTILLPAGSRYNLLAEAFGNESCLAIVRRLPNEFSFFANELPDLPQTRAIIEKYLKLGAIGIGEQKFPVECDSAPMRLVAEIARDYKVPVLMHFQHGAFNTGFERFGRMLKRYPQVRFIGHAQTMWANVHEGAEQPVMYPRGKVARGGYTDRYLTDYPNFFADLSAGSGFNALERDPDHAREFIKRHQDKLLFGSDCNDRDTNGAGTPKCIGRNQLAQLRALVTDEHVLGKVLWGNAAKLFGFR